MGGRGGVTDMHCDQQRGSCVTCSMLCNNEYHSAAAELPPRHMSNQQQPRAREKKYCAKYNIGSPHYLFDGKDHYRCVF